MKGVVLAGGRGTRLRPITHSLAKQLVPVANEPIILYGLRDLAASGIKKVCVIISPETGDEVRSVVGDGSALGLEITYLVQPSPDGLAAALALALPWVDGDDCVMYLGDNLVKGGVADLVRDFEQRRPNCQIMLAEVERPQQYGVAELAADGTIIRLLEKPTNPPSNLALVGVYLFDDSILEAVSSIEPSGRGELEITDAIQYLVDHGKEVRASIVSDWWKDTGRKEDLLHANELVLKGLEADQRGEIVDTKIRGAVSVGTGSRVLDSSITGPVVIGDNTLIERAIIGPFTAIGDACYLSDCSIERSVVMDGSRVHEWKIRGGLIGREAILQGPAPNKYVSVTLGEHSEIGTT